MRSLSLRKKILLRIVARVPHCCCRFLAHVPSVRRAALSRLLEDPVLDDRLIVDMEPRTHVWRDSLALFPVAAPESRVLHEEADLRTHRRYAVLAHWDPQHIVDPYVLYLAHAIRDLGYAVILVSDSLDRATGEDVFAAELRRISPGYDFASWRVAFENYGFLFDADEVLLLNDSIFGPLWPLEPVHARMNALPCDWWGLSESEDPFPHTQSYYLVFRQTVLGSTLFRNFWQAVDSETDHDIVVMKYEEGLSHQLHNGVFRVGAYVSPAQFASMRPRKRRSYTPLYMYWRTLVRRFRFPVIKRDILMGKHPWNCIQGWRTELAKTEYPVALIDAYFRRIGHDGAPSAHKTGKVS